jgi:spore maturation protein CgeB
MSGLRILYLGAKSGTALDRAQAYRRLGHVVQHLDPRASLPHGAWVDHTVWHVGAEVFAPWVRGSLLQQLQGQLFDLCHVDNGALLDAGTVQALRRFCSKVINYNIDDPFGQRDGRRFSLYLKSLPAYDHVVVVRNSNLAEAQAHGARSVQRVFMTADELSHAPRAVNTQDQQSWAADVLFLGTWMPERGPFLLELLRAGVPLRIRGDRWHKAPQWADLRDVWLGPSVSGDAYAKALQCAKVSIGLLSKGNRDMHTTRSLEIPALGGVLCAERTPEHMQMYAQEQEAVFWSNAAECAQHCRELLADEAKRLALAQAGQRRVHSNQHFNQPMLRSVLASVGFDHGSSVQGLRPASAAFALPVAHEAALGVSAP